MSRWPRHKLEDVAIVLAGFAWRSEFFSDSPSSGPPIIRIQNLGQNENAKLVYYSGPIVSGYWVEPNEILISLSGSFKVCRWSGPRALLNQRIVVVRPQSSMRQEFLFYQLLSRVQEIEKAAQGVAVSNTSMGIVREMEVDAPSLLEQDRIVRLLDEADQLRRMRAEADRHTDGLIPAMFYEMFSGAIANRLSYPRHSLEEVCISPAGIKAGPFGSSLKKESYTTQGPRVYGQEQIIAGDFSIGDYHISKEKFDEMRAYSVSPGDVLISLVGTFGKVAVVPEHVEPGIINPRLIRIRVNQRMILPMFLKHFLELNETQTQLQSLARGQTMGVLNATLLRELTVPVPSLEQQNAFAARVAEIRGIGAEQTASRRRLDDLFQSLLHRAFQGEL